MDTISAGATLACYAEIENKRLTGDEILSLLTAIANGSGIGKELGKGSYEFARSKGKSEVSMSVKKLELPAYDPRGAYGMALGYAVSTRGGCHLRAYPIGNEILRKPVPTDRFTFSGKARIVKIAEDANAIID
jgi:aldehyde:ferredoxin oxidoreductase